MIEIALREGTTLPLEFDLGEISANTRAFAAVDLSTATEIIFYCRATRDKAVVKTFTLTADPAEIVVTTDEDGNNNRLQVVLTGTKLVYLDKEYRCYFRVTNSDGKLLTYPEGDDANPYIIIRMLEKFA